MEGVARYIHETTQRIVRSHPEHEFHFIFDRPYDPSFIYADNVTPYVLGPATRHPLLWYLWFEWRIPALLGQIQADVFLSGDLSMSLSTPVPTVMVSHDLAYEHYPEFLTWSARTFYRYYSPRYHHAASRLISVSQATKSDIINQYGTSEDKITVAHNACPPGFQPLAEERKQTIRNEISDGLPYFIYVGSLHPRKNVLNLLKAFDLFKQNNNQPHKLIIYGRKAWKNADLESTYDKMISKSEVIFLDNSILDVPTVMGAAEALCYISLFEGFGIPILEGFHAGVPVITSNRSSMPEVAGDAALQVDPMDTTAIAAAMTRITTDPELRNKLLTKAKTQREKFSWDRSAELIYEQIIVAAGK